MYPKVYLHSGKEIAVKRMHPWIFSGAIAKSESNPADGTIVEVFDKKNNYLATGHFYNGSIAVKLFSYSRLEINDEFWKNKLSVAYNVRKNESFDGLNSQTDCYRLVHGEGDGFPGLILDFYAGVVVFQAHTVGMWMEKEKILSALHEIFGENLLAVYDKSAETLPTDFAKTIQNGFLFSKENSFNMPHIVYENGNRFYIDWVTGQKTGFFLDQRDNRQLLAHYAKGKRVLNSFCYSGGFSIYAIRAGASLVHSVDVSKKAVELVDRNVELNFGETAVHEAFDADVMTFLKNNDQFYDLIVLDPPAYAKNISKRHNAVQGYKRLNMEGIKRLAKGGILFTFSCSQVVDRELFYNTIVSAALEVGRSVRVLHHLSQGADHPVNLFHPEGSYLKGLVLYVE